MVAGLYVHLTSDTKRRIDDLESDIKLLQTKSVTTDLNVNTINGRLTEQSNQLARIEKAIDKLADKLDKEV